MTTRTRVATAGLVVGIGLSQALGAPVLKLRPSAVLLADEKGTALRDPQGVGCIDAKTFVVADSGNGRVVKVEVTGALARVVSEVKVDEVGYPIRADVDSKGNFVVLDGKSRRIARLTAAGAFTGWVNVPAPEGVPAVVPRSFALDPQDRLYVLDLAGRRVAVLSSAGQFERGVAFPSDLRSPSDLAVDPRGTIYVVDGTGRRVFAAKAQDAALAPLSAPLAEDLDYASAIDTDGSGHLFVADQNGGGIVVVGTDGSFRGRQSAYGWKEGYLRYPSGLCATGKGLLVVADRENQRVQVFEIAE